MLKPSFIIEKKWWQLLLLGVANSIIFAFLLGNLPSSTMNMVQTPITLVIPLILVTWSLSSTSFSKFFLSTLFLVATFILVAPPLSNLLYDYNFERLYPGESPSLGDGFVKLLGLIFYMIMCLVSWFIALILTFVSIRKNKNRTNANVLENKHGAEYV